MTNIIILDEVSKSPVGINIPTPVGVVIALVLMGILAFLIWTQRPR